MSSSSTSARSVLAAATNASTTASSSGSPGTAPKGVGQAKQELALGPRAVLRGSPPLRAHRDRGLDELEAVLEPGAMELEGRERRRRRDRPPTEPRVERPRELRVAHAQRRVRNPAAAREQVERELQRLEVRVARDSSEVGGAVAGRFLRALDVGRALQLVVDERRVQVPPPPCQRGRERDRILHGELRPGADREVCGVGCVAEQDDVPVVPRLVRDLREVEPERAVREQLPTAQLVREQALTERKALLLVQLVQSGRTPDGLGALDDERRHPLVVGVRVGVEEPVLRFAKGERERVEDVIGAEPDVLAALGPHLGAEVTEAAHEAVRAVRADDEVGLGELLDLDAELERDAQLAASLLEDLEEPLSRDCGEGVTARRQLPALVADVDPVPAREGVRDLEVRLRIGVAERTKRLLAEDDAEAEGRIGRIPLEDADVDTPVELAQQDRQVQPGRPAADDLDIHARASWRRSSSSTSATVGKRTSSSQPASS